MRGASLAVAGAKTPGGVIDFSTFHDRTVASFATCAPPARPPDFVSPSRSVYWDLGDRVVRAADHWGRVRSCFWTIDGHMHATGTLVGVCRYADFWKRVGLTVMRDRRVPLRPGGGPALDGCVLSFLPPGGSRIEARVARATAFRIELDDGRTFPRRSRGAAWVVG